MNSKSVIIGLSEGIKFDGTPMPNTAEVVNMVAELLKMGYADVAILSGGKAFKFRDRLPRAEALAMRDAMGEKGITKGKVFAESISVDTPTNAYFSKLIVVRKLPRAKRILLVASTIHMPRSKYIFKNIFGPEYTIVPYPTKDWTAKSDLETARACESMSRRLSASFFREYHFVQGDDKTFRRIINDKSIFNKNNTLTKSQRGLLDRLVALRKSYIRTG